MITKETFEDIIKVRINSLEFYGHMKVNNMSMTLIIYA